MLIAFLQPIHAQSVAINKKNATLIINFNNPEFEGYEGGSVAFSHDDTMLVYPTILKNPKFGNWTNQLWLHYLKNDTSKILDLNGSLSSIGELRFSPDDKKLLFVGSSCDNNQSHTTFYIIDLLNPHIQCTNFSNVSSADWMPDGSVVLLQNKEENDTISIYHDGTEKLLYTKQITPPYVSLNSSHIVSIKTSHDGKKIALWYFIRLYSETQILSTDEGKIIDTFAGGHPRWSQDDKTLLYSIPTNTGYYTNGPLKGITYVNLLDLDNNKTTTIDTVPMGINDLSLSEDSKNIFYVILVPPPYAFLNLTSGVYKINLNHDNNAQPAPLRYLETPLQQIKSGIPSSKVKCNKGFHLFLKREDGSPACVKPQTAQKLVERGWSLQVTTAWFEFKQTITSHDDCKNIPWIMELVVPNASQQILIQSMTNATLIADYFKNHEVTLLQVKYDLGNIVSNPISMCGYPTYYFHVSQSDASKMIGLGYTPIDEKDVQRTCSLNNCQVIK